MQQEILTTYMGFQGQITFPIDTLEIHQRQGSPAFFPTANRAIQYIRSHNDEAGTSLLPSHERQYLLLAGLIFPEMAESFLSLLKRLVTACEQGQYDSFPAGDYCGCLVVGQHLWLFKTRTSNTTIFYSRQGGQVYWSTDPSNLAEHDLDNTALAQCCAGHDSFIYTGISFVEAGTIVRIDQGGEQRFPLLNPVSSLPLPPRVAFNDATRACRYALLEATRSLVRTGQKVALLLSGGIDSSVVAAALTINKVNVVAAYHFFVGNSPADESDYAQAVCQATGIPFVPIPVSNGRSDYLSEQWTFPHPYGHAGFKWMDQVAQQAERDGVTILVTGRSGDAAFGPWHSYGLSDVLCAPIALNEKLAMTLGAFSTDWLLPDIIKSIRRNHSLIDARSLSSATRQRSSQTRSEVPFLRQQFHDQSYNIYDVTRLSPQDLTLETSVWQPRGIHVYHPYHAKGVHHLSSHLPLAYRLLPYRGMKIVKPVLRAAFADELPPMVVRYRGSSWLIAAEQKYCLHHRSYLEQLIGSSQSRVVQRGIVEPEALRTVLKYPELIREQSSALIATAMTELFLRQYKKESKCIASSGPLSRGSM